MAPLVTRMRFTLKGELCADPLAAVAALARTLNAARDVARGTPLSAIAERDWRDVLFTDEEPTALAQKVAKRITPDDVPLVGRLLATSCDNLRIILELPEPWRTSVLEAALEHLLCSLKGTMPPLRLGMGDAAASDPTERTSSRSGSAPALRDGKTTPPPGTSGQHSLLHTPKTPRPQLAPAAHLSPTTAGISKSQASALLCELIRLELVTTTEAVRMLAGMLASRETVAPAATIVARLASLAGEGDVVCEAFFAAAVADGMKDAFITATLAVPETQYERFFVLGVRGWRSSSIQLTLFASGPRNHGSRRDNGRAADEVATDAHTLARTTGNAGPGSPFFAGCYLPARDAAIATTAHGIFFVTGITEGTTGGPAAAAGGGDTRQPRPQPPTASSADAANSSVIRSVPIALPSTLTGGHADGASPMGPQQFTACGADVTRNGVAVVALNHTSAPAARGAGTPAKAVVVLIDTHRATPAVKETVLLPNVAAVTCIKALSQRGGPTAATTAQSVSYCVAVARDDRPHHHSLRIFSGTSLIREVEKAHDDFILSLATSSENDNVLWSSCRDSTVRLWDIRTGKSQANSLSSAGTVHRDAVTAVTVIKELVVTGSLDRVVALWDSRKPSQPVATKEVSGAVLKLVTGPNGLLVIACVDGLLAASTHPPLEIEFVVPGALYHDVRFVDLPPTPLPGKAPPPGTGARAQRTYLCAWGNGIDVYGLSGSW